MPSVIKPLPEPMLTVTHDTIWHLWAPLIKHLQTKPGILGSMDLKEVSTNTGNQGSNLQEQGSEIGFWMKIVVVFNGPA